MTIAQVLADVSTRLERAGIAFMVTGSLASSLHGEPRTTLDVDVVIDPTPESLRRFVDALPTTMYVEPDAAEDALRQRGQFNVIDTETGWKIDLIIRKDRAFSREEFARRQEAEISGTRTFVASAEDTIIAKLEWARASDSERQLRDIEGILAVSGDGLDRGYLKRWIAELDLTTQWSRVRSQDT
jgi:Nucleotidyltransferase of unknown function (DUF6036)